MLNTYERQSKRKRIATLLTVLVVAGIVVIGDHIKSTQKTPSSTMASTTPTNATTVTPNTTSTPAATSSSTASAPTTGYTDGTYSATSNYYVPHGQESITVSVTLKGGDITSASVQNSENDFDSAQYQEEFAATYKNYVVGKAISGLQLSVVSGASDTTQGFNDAISQIATKAQA